MGFKQNLLKRKVERELQKIGVVTVNQSSCDGCGSCVEVCPQSAIQLITLSENEVKELPFKDRLKVKLKGNKKSQINTDLCTVCGLCLKQCHEFAIRKV